MDSARHNGNGLRLAKRKGSGIRSPFRLLKQVPQLLLLYFEALSALPLRNISLTVATKWCADAGAGTAPLKMVL